MPTDKDIIIKSFYDYFTQQEHILFVYIYGSFVKEANYRDIDLAIYSTAPELTELGRMRIDLMKLTNIEVDLTYLNNLPNKNPAFGYKIVTSGKLFYNSDSDKHDEFKVRTLLSYFDTRRLREIMDKAFLNRLQTGNFGERNYA